MVVVQFLVVRLSASATYSMPALLDQGPNITFKKYPNHFCEGNFDADNHTLWEGICSNATCEERCVRIRCVCWDFQSASQLCRITNYTSAIQVSHSGFDAYVDSSHPVGRKICCLCLILHYVKTDYPLLSLQPPPGPPISPGGASRYGCQGQYAKLAFCDQNKSVAERVSALIGTPSDNSDGPRFCF